MQTCVSSKCRFQYGHSSADVEVFLYCNSCGYSPIHLACNNDDNKYTCLNCQTEFKFESDDLIKAKFLSAAEKNKSDELLIQNISAEKDKLLRENEQLLKSLTVKENEKNKFWTKIRC